jgi:predicted nucleic-acid-binding Zn-ribbon protein
MSNNKEVKEYFIKQGLKLECVICKNTLFWTRTTLMNTSGMSFLGLDWANKNATNYVCNACGYVHWFLDKN